MSSPVEKDFLRLIMMIHDIVLPVCKAYFKTNVLVKAGYHGDLKRFLEKHKHDIYHLIHNDVRCCQCGNTSATNNNSKRLFGKQFNKLFVETDAKVRNHVLWGPGGRPTQHCICGFRVVARCSVDDMDISMVNAIIQTCAQGLDNSHTMWLKKIVEQRNELCHLEDLNRLTINETNTTWEYLKGSTLGLAESIPPEHYKESIEREIKLLKRVEFQREEVKPVLDSIKEECAQMKETMCQVFKQLNGMIEEFPKLEQRIVGASNRISDQVGAQAVIMEENTSKIIETITEKSQNVEEKLNSLSDELKRGTFQHQNHEVTFEVKWAQNDPVSDDVEDDVVVTWSINKASFSDIEKAEIIQNIRKMVETAAIWSPYKIKFAGIGSVVIATMLNKDIFTDKGNFESSVRQFLDTLLSVSGINCQSPCTINVEISISKAIPKEIFNSEETNILLEKYFDKVQQVVPEMIDDSSESSTDMPFIYSIQLNKGENLSTEQSYIYTRDKNFLLIGDKSDFDILQQIKQAVEATFYKANVSEISVRSLIKPWSTNVRTVYAVLASSHTRRTAINTILNLLPCPKRIDLVPSDGMRYGNSSSKSITIDEGQNWKGELSFHIKDDLISDKDVELTGGEVIFIEDLSEEDDSPSHSIEDLSEEDYSRSHSIEDLTEEDASTSFLKDIGLKRRQLDHIDAKAPKYRKMDPGIIDEEQLISNSNQTYGRLQRQLDTVAKATPIQPNLEPQLNKKADIRRYLKTWNPHVSHNESLHEACSNGNMEKVKMLLKYKADVNKCTDDGTSPLFAACSEGETEIVKMLLEYKADVNKCTDDGSSPLFAACSEGETEIVKMLLEYKADVNKCTDDGTSPLFAACSEGETEIVKMLLEYKADVNKCRYDGTSPLSEACRKGLTEIVKMLLEYKAGVNKCTYEGTSPLVEACRKGLTEIVKMLLEYKADVNKCTYDGTSPLFAACRKGETEIVKMLLEYKADVNKCTDYGTSPLFEACRKGETEIVKMLLEYKANVNKCTADGTSPLFAACRKGETEIVKMLLDYKADTSKCTKDGKSALIIAREKSYKDIVTLIEDNSSETRTKIGDTSSSALMTSNKNDVDI